MYDIYQILIPHLSFVKLHHVLATNHNVQNLMSFTLILIYHTTVIYNTVACIIKPYRYHNKIQTYM